MKKFELLLAFILLIFFIPIVLSRNTPTLNEGDIVFIDIKSSGEDGFSIKTTISLKPNTIIRFTDSEWNGDYFHLGEGDLIWNSGDSLIQAGTIIDFKYVQEEGEVSHGMIDGSLNISKKEDAVFAYEGAYRMPTRFLSAAANDELGFGTLLKTNLEIGKTAFLFQ